MTIKRALLSVYTIGFALVFGGLATAQTRDSLPSWNDGNPKKSIIEFVTKVTKKGSPDFVPPAERVATFDNDGTLWAEQPMYFQLIFALHRVGVLAPQYPEWKNKEPFASLLKGDVKGALAGGEPAIAQIVMATHAGMTSEEFEKIVKDWISTARHPTTKRSYTEMVYQPMLELLAYLRTNGFKTFIVSGGGVEFMRPWTDWYQITHRPSPHSRIRKLRRRPADAAMDHRRTGSTIRALRPPHGCRARVGLRPQLQHRPLG